MIDVGLGDHRFSRIDRSSLREAHIAVVIPAYNQPEHLKDAVLSTLQQTVRSQLATVIVNDGCPCPSTDWVSRFFRDAYPGEVFYLKKQNGGLSSARNYGVRFALDAWPWLEAVFLLDADNKLSPQTIEMLWVRLSQSTADVGWAYQDLRIFGTEDALWQTGTPFNTFRLIHENFSDAGSLIRRAVFEKEIWFDESMKSGYEDWEFFLHASLSGFRGIHVADTGFLYRKQEYSMLTGSQEKHDQIYTFIRRKHAPNLRHDRLIRLEHEQMPRFAIVDVDSGTVRFATDPIASPSRTLTIDQFIIEAVRWASDPPPKIRYVPPILVFARGRFVDLIAHLRLLPGILFVLQKSLRHRDSAALLFDLDDNPDAIRLLPRQASGEVVLWAITLRKWIHLRTEIHDRLEDVILHGSGLQTDTFTLSIGQSFWRPQDRLLSSSLWRSMRNELAARDAIIRELRQRLSLPGGSGGNGSALTGPGLQQVLRTTAFEILNEICVAMRWSNGDNIASSDPKHLEDRYFPSHAEWSHVTQVEQTGTRFPYSASMSGDEGEWLNVWFVMPWLRLGGVELCVLNLARQLSRLSSQYRVHLALTANDEMELEPEWLEVFENVAFLSATAEESRPLVDCLSGADAIINAHSMACYKILPEIKNACDVQNFSFLQVTDLDKDGCPGGYPLVASREYANLIDSFLVPSSKLKRFLLSLGVPEEKLTLIPNAANVSPSSEGEAIAIARSKGKRRYSEQRPLRILFCGRFDYQKGIDRLEGVIQQLHRDGVPFVLEMIGKAVLAETNPSDSLPCTTVCPATVRKDRLAQAYRKADVFLLPSRFEGVPLAAIEAMTFGNILIATDVGGVGEIIKNGYNGFLLEEMIAEKAMISTTVSIIRDIVDNPERHHELRLAASRTGMKTSWAKSAAILAHRIESGLARR
ncbi:MAG TPA: glycosyltransferase [Vicinamibacteria bacterium]|nr:glycosyltransferase [Vicinamibacteria bacterium]